MAYKNVLARSKRLVKDLEKIIQRMDDLEESNHKLRNSVETEFERAKAELRVEAKND